MDFSHAKSFNLSSFAPQDFVNAKPSSIPIAVVRRQSQLWVGSRTSCMQLRQRNSEGLHEFRLVLPGVSWNLDNRGFCYQKLIPRRAAGGEIPFVSRPNLLMTFFCFCRLFTSCGWCDLEINKIITLFHHIFDVPFWWLRVFTFFFTSQLFVLRFSADCRKK